MQLVARFEKSDPPTRTAVCAAAAVAVVRLLTDDRAVADGEWAPPVRRWVSGRIRKHCRRARGVAWQRVLELPGVTAEVDGAQVRALVPGSTGELPAAVAKLQLSGSEPADPAARPVLDPQPDGPLVVSICPDPVLPLGKAAAAAGHAAQLALAAMPAGRVAGWAAGGFPVLVEHPVAARWSALLRTAQVRVIDGGLTVVAPGTCTAVARWR